MTTPRLSELAAGTLLLGLTACPSDEIRTKEDFEIALDVEAMKVTGIMEEVSRRLSTDTCTLWAKTEGYASGDYLIDCGKRDFDYRVNKDSHDACGFTVTDVQDTIMQFLLDERGVSSQRFGSLLTDGTALRCNSAGTVMICSDMNADRPAALQYSSNEKTPLDSTAVREAAEACENLQNQLSSLEHEKVRLERFVQ